MSPFKTFTVGFFTIVASPCLTGCLLHWEMLTSSPQSTFLAIASGIGLSFVGIIFLATGASKSVEEGIVDWEDNLTTTIHFDPGPECLDILHKEKDSLDIRYGRGWSDDTIQRLLW